MTAALTLFDVALGRLLDGVEKIGATEVPLADAVNLIAAEMPPLKTAVPEFDIATADGWALRARDIVGASSYSPLQLPKSPSWIEAGERMPEGCDCVIDADLAEQNGGLFQVLADAAPGHGVRRTGNDLAPGRTVVAPGRPIAVADLLAMRAAGFDRARVRSPRVRVIDVPSGDIHSSSQFVCEFAKGCGARSTLSRAAGRDAASIVSAIEQGTCDLVLIVGGTGMGRADATIDALVSRNALLAHGLAIEPGRTAAIGRIGETPVIAIPGMRDQALGVCLSMVQPVLDKLSGREARARITRPLSRKIASTVGVAELVLLRAAGESWLPLASGQISLNAIVDADAWMIVPAKSEGYAASTALGALPFRESL